MLRQNRSGPPGLKNIECRLIKKIDFGAITAIL